MFWLMIHILCVSRSSLNGEVNKNKMTFFSFFLCLFWFRLSKTFWTMVTKVLLRLSFSNPFLHGQDPVPAVSVCNLYLHGQCLSPRRTLCRRPYSALTLDTSACVRPSAQRVIDVWAKPSALLCSRSCFKFA